jgi:hypothetical protein
VFWLVISTTYAGCTREWAVTPFGFGIPFLDRVKIHLLLRQNPSVLAATIWKSATQLIVRETANKEQDTMTMLPPPGNDSTNA